MEEIVSKFSGKFAITEEEQEVIVVDKQKVGLLKSSRESFKRRMWNLWRPKAHVLIFDLADDRFAFGFNSHAERTTIMRGGP